MPVDGRYTSCSILIQMREKKLSADAYRVGQFQCMGEGSGDDLRFLFVLDISNLYKIKDMDN